MNCKGALLCKKIMGLFKALWLIRLRKTQDTKPPY